MTSEASCVKRSPSVLADRVPRFGIRRDEDSQNPDVTLSVVNFNNILQAAFAPIFLINCKAKQLLEESCAKHSVRKCLSKHYCTKKLRVKCC